MTLRGESGDSAPVKRIWLPKKPAEHATVITTLHHSAFTTKLNASKPKWESNKATEVEDDGKNEKEYKPVKIEDEDDDR
ncbi:MAG: hypothetical protein M1834_009353 [Cirrosporium novae-zelandiae]|nr:MAG: hypothetical protein M1834_009353 [Cirrosporium novae-zelandiae]